MLAIAIVVAFFAWQKFSASNHTSKSVASTATKRNEQPERREGTETRDRAEPASSSVAPASQDSSPSSNTPAEAKPVIEPLVKAPPVAQQFAILNEILASGNDSDARLDRELKSLPAEARTAIRKMYRETKKESLNARGTMLFLLGRNIESSEDLQFLAEVAHEPVCRSLSDCARFSNAPEDAEHVRDLDLVLAYPQVVAVRAASEFIKSPEANAALQAQAVAVLKAGAQSRSPTVASFAQSALHNQLQGPHQGR